MGFDRERFVNLSDDDDFTCAICQGIYDRPVITPCRHTYCKECIESWIQIKNSCPLDQKRLRSCDLIQIPYMLQSIINKLLIHCDYHSSGCQEIVPVGDLRKHLIQCIFCPTACKTLQEVNSRYLQRPLSMSNNLIYDFSSVHLKGWFKSFFYLLQFKVISIWVPHLFQL